MDFIRGLGVGDDAAALVAGALHRPVALLPRARPARRAEPPAASGDGDPRSAHGRRRRRAPVHQPHGPMGRVGLPVGRPARSASGSGCTPPAGSPTRPPSSGSAPESRVGGVVAYLVFATAFGGEAFRVIAAIGILALGLALTDRGPRGSPQPEVADRLGPRPSRRCLSNQARIRSIRSMRRSGRPLLFISWCSSG